MTSAPGPPSLDDAAAFTKALARELSQLSGDPYGEPSIGELQAGIAMEEEGLGNPAAFAHTTIDWYIQGTGDFLYGAGETSKDQYDLAFSSAAATRSACEYAGICWWLADPDISVERRISTRLWRFWLGCPGRWGGARSLWADDAVVEVLPGGTSQGGEDAFGVVVRTLDVQGLAVVAELDRARAGPGTEVPGGGLEARGGLEAETSGVVDGAEHQVLGQVQRCRQG